MDFKIDYTFLQEYLPTKRHRKPRTRSLTRSMTVSIPELQDKEFPVAFIVHDYKSVYEDVESYSDFDGKCGDYRMFPEEIRTYNGRLYTPIRVTHGAAISTVFENPETFLWRLWRIADHYYYCAADNFSENSIVVGDNSKEREKEIIKEAENYVFHDGKFWELCGEPMYMINTFGLGHNHGGTGFFVQYSYNPNISNKNYFNALQREEAIAYGKAVAANRGDTESIDRIGKYDNIEVLMPEMVRANPGRDHGDGDPFMNSIEELINGSSSSFEAGLLTIAMTAMSIGQD